MRLLKKEISPKVHLLVELDEQDVAGQFDFGNAAENAAYLKRFENMELLNANVSIQYYDGSGHVSGEDSLGACHIRNGHVEEDAMEIVKDHDMVNNAFNDLQKKLTEVMGSIDHG